MKFVASTYKAFCERNSVPSPSPFFSWMFGELSRRKSKEEVFGPQAARRLDKRIRQLKQYTSDRFQGDLKDPQIMRSIIASSKLILFHAQQISDLGFEGVLGDHEIEYYRQNVSNMMRLWENPETAEYLADASNPDLDLDAQCGAWMERSKYVDHSVRNDLGKVAIPIRLSDIARKVRDAFEDRPYNYP